MLSSHSAEGWRSLYGKTPFLDILEIRRQSHNEAVKPPLLRQCAMLHHEYISYSIVYSIAYSFIHISSLDEKHGQAQLFPSFKLPQRKPFGELRFSASACTCSPLRREERSMLESGITALTYKVTDVCCCMSTYDTHKRLTSPLAECTIGMHGKKKFTRYTKVPWKCWYFTDFW